MQACDWLPLLTQSNKSMDIVFIDHRLQYHYIYIVHCKRNNYNKEKYIIQRPGNTFTNTHLRSIHVGASNKVLKGLLRDICAYVILLLYINLFYE